MTLFFHTGLCAFSAYGYTGKVLDPVGADTTDQKSLVFFLNRELLDDTEVASVANIWLQVDPVLTKKPQTREERVFAEPHTAGWLSCLCHTSIEVFWG